MLFFFGYPIVLTALAAAGWWYVAAGDVTWLRVAAGILALLLTLRVLRMWSSIWALNRMYGRIEMPPDGAADPLGHWPGIWPERPSGEGPSAGSGVGSTPPRKP